MLTEREKRFLQTVERLADWQVEACRELVRINTVNPYSGDSTASSEEEGQLFLKPMLEELGARVSLFECPNDIFQRMGILGPKKRDFKDRPNLVAEFDFGGTKRVIVNGHMDTVGAEGMAIEPFGGELRDGKIWGRGAADCKGGLSAGLAVLRALVEHRSELRGAIVFESTVDEECNGSGAGTLSCINAGYREAEMALSVDVSDLDVWRGCGGTLTADITVEGRSGHASVGGVSAIEKALVVKRVVDRFKEERESRQSEYLLNLGVFHAGAVPSVVPASARLSLSINYSLSEAAEAEKEGKGWGGAPLREEFERLVREEERSDEWLSRHPSQIEWVKDLLPFEVPNNSPLVEGLAAAYRDVLGREPRRRTSPTWVDAAHYPLLAGVPACIFGPGITSVAHAPEENVSVDNLISAAKISGLLLYRQLTL